MKQINEMNLEELAAHAVTLDGWEWRLCAGMLVPEKGRVPDEDIEMLRHMTAYEVEEFKSDMVREFRPDLTDPATLGCVLAMVRKKHGYGCVTHYDLELYWGVYDREGVLIVGQGGVKGSCSDYYTQEAHALIAALAEEAQ